MKGTVKWFNSKKGFGFITTSDNDTVDSGDIFVHYTAIDADGFKTLEQGQAVEFDLIKGTKGSQAQNVKAT